MKRIASIAVLLFGMALCGSASAQFTGFYPNLAPHDPPGRAFPGKYFDWKAQFYLRMHDYRAALEMFELAGFWAYKPAQYNAGMMYFEGIGVPADKTRGTAWLAIAAENRDDLANQMLQKAYATLTPDEKKQADGIWHQLDSKYGDAQTIPRAVRQFNVEMGNVTGSHVGFRDNVKIAELGSDDPNFIPAAEYYRRQSETLDALVSSITGHVTVGAVTTLPVSPPH